MARKLKEKITTVIVDDTNVSIEKTAPVVEEVNTDKAPVVERQIRILQPIYNEMAGQIISEGYKYFNDYATLISNKSTRMGRMFAEFVE
jgi:hypothetical protein